MAYRKHTLRTMSPTARRVARLVGEIESSASRLKHLVPELQRLDLDSAALMKSRTRYPLNDTDLWGIQNALVHGIGSHYFDDNLEWAKGMLERIGEMRKPLFE